LIGQHKRKKEKAENSVPAPKNGNVGDDMMMQQVILTRLSVLFSTIITELDMVEFHL
jgi:hypothetical protein